VLWTWFSVRFDCRLLSLKAQNTSSHDQRRDRSPSLSSPLLSPSQLGPPFLSPLYFFSRALSERGGALNDFLLPVRYGLACSTPPLLLFPVPLLPAIVFLHFVPGKPVNPGPRFLLVALSLSHKRRNVSCPLSKEIPPPRTLFLGVGDGGAEHGLVRSLPRAIIFSLGAFFP